MAIRAKVYESNRQIASTPGVRLEGDFGSAAFGGGAKANELPRAVVNFANAAQGFTDKIYDRAMQEREELLAADILNDTLQFDLDSNNKARELEGQYQGREAGKVLPEMERFTGEKINALISKYSNNETAQRVILSRLAPYRAKSMNWAGGYVKEQEEKILQDVDNDMNAKLLERSTNMSPEEWRLELKIRGREMDVVRYRGRPEAREAAMRQLDLYYWSNYAANYPADFKDRVGSSQVALSGNGAQFVAMLESGEKGIRAIGNSANGGLAYGTFQISSKPGTTDSLVKWLGNKGFSEAYKHFSGVKDWNGEEGREAWKTALDLDLINPEMEYQFILETHVQPTLNALTPELKNAVETSPALQSVLWDVSVQHGAGKAPMLMNKAFEGSHGNLGQFLDNLNTLRGTQFESSTEKEREAIFKRHKKAKEMILGTNLPPSSSWGELNAIADKTLSNRAKQEEEGLKAAKDQANKDLVTMYHEGSLGVTAIQERMDLLSAVEYDKFMKMTTGEASLPEKSNTETYLQLNEIALSGSSSFPAMADDALRSGLLTQADYNVLQSKAQQVRPVAAQRGNQIIKQLTGYSELNPDPAASTSYMNASLDWDDYIASEAGQKATYEQKIEMAKQIGNNYRVVTLEKSLLTLPMPLHLQGSRTNPDIDKTVLVTKAKWDPEDQEGLEREYEKIWALKNMIQQYNHANTQPANSEGRK